MTFKFLDTWGGGSSVISSCERNEAKFLNLKESPPPGGYYLSNYIC